MKQLTERQKEILDFLREYITEHKYPPTIREVGRKFIISVKAAYDHIKALEKKGQIRCHENCSRAIEIVSEDIPSVDDEIISIPILGNVAAGRPLFARENWEGDLKLPAVHFKSGRYFALYVKGDSMYEAGILDGDTAVFIHQNNANNGDIVVAMVNDDAVTLKRFYKEKHRIKLKAENPVYPPIYSQNVTVLGKLIFIYRNYD